MTMARCQRAFAWKERDRGLLIARLIALHADIAAQGNERETEIGIAALKTEQTRAQTNAESFHPNADCQRCPEMAKLMDNDHDRQQRPKG